MHPLADKVWESAQQSLRSMVTPEIYNLWFAPLRTVALEKELLLLEVGDDFCEVWLKDNYLGLLQEVCSEAARHPVRIKFQVGKTGAYVLPAHSPSSPSRFPSSPAEL